MLKVLSDENFRPTIVLYKGFRCLMRFFRRCGGLKGNLKNNVKSFFLLKID